jgi:hypothetical protein
MKTPTAAFCILACAFGVQAQDEGPDLRLRQVAQPDDAFAEPAYFAYTRPSGGDTTYQIQGALGVVSGRPRKWWGHEVDWFVDAEVGKNTEIGSEQDYRKLQVGWLFTPEGVVDDVLQGPVRPNSGSSGVLWNVTLSYNDDDEKNRASTLLQLGGTWVITALQTAPFQLTPRAGLYAGEILDAPATAFEGSTSGAFAEIGMAWKPRPQWTVSGKLRYLKELSVPGRNEENYHYVEAGVRYLLYTPGTTGLRPSIGLFRAVGEDPRSGIPDVAYTRLAVELLY